MLETIPQLHAQMDLYIASPPSEDTARKLEMLADTWVSLNREKKAIVCLTQSLELYDSFPTLALESARIALKLGHIHRTLGHHKETGASFKHALTAYKTAYPTPHLELAGMLYVLGTFMEQLMKLTPAETYYQESLHMIEKLEGKQHPQCSVIRKKLETLISKRHLYKK